MEERDFGWALRQLKAGHKVTREGWNGKGQWLRYVDLYTDKEFKLTEQPYARGTWVPFIAIKTVDNHLVPWLASQTDMLANDWFVL